MEVRCPPCYISVIILICPSAPPTEQFFTQSFGLYVGGDQNAFHTRYPAPVTPIVSPVFLSCDPFVDPSHRPSSSFLSEFVRLALRPQTFNELVSDSSLVITLHLDLVLFFFYACHSLLYELCLIMFCGMELSTQLITLSGTTRQFTDTRREDNRHAFAWLQKPSLCLASSVIRGGYAG